MCSRFRHNLKNFKFPTAVKQTKEMHKTVYRKCTILCYSGFAPMHCQLPLPSLIRWYQGSVFCMVGLDSIRQSSFQEVWPAHCDDKTRICGILPSFTAKTRTVSGNRSKEQAFLKVHPWYDLFTASFPISVPVTSQIWNSASFGDQEQRGLGNARSENFDRIINLVYWTSNSSILIFHPLENYDLTGLGEFCG